MTLFKFLVTIFVTSFSFLKSKVPLFTIFVSPDVVVIVSLCVVTNLLTAIDAKLQTAISSGAVYSTISVQRLLHLMTPKFYIIENVHKIITITLR